MDAVADTTVVIDTCRGVQNSDASYMGSSIDDDPGHNYRSMLETGVSRDDCGRVNQIGQGKPIRQCTLCDIKSTTAITERYNDLRHSVSQFRKHVEVSENGRPAKQGSALVGPVVKKADNIISLASSDICSNDGDSACAENN
jgi:hypothetical protein